MKWLLALICSLVVTSSFAATPKITSNPKLASTPKVASAPKEITLEEMASQADHIIVGVVTGADMIDWKGNQVTDERAMTGPNVKNTIRLRIKVNKVLVSNAKKVPKILMVPLDPMEPFSLGQIRSAHAEHHNEPFLLLLKGPDFQPIKPGRFGQPLTNKAAVLEIYRKTHKSKSH